MLAQSLVEYSTLSSIAESIQRASYSAQVWFGSLSAREWAIVAGVVVLAMVVRSRRRIG